jgi:predicted RNA polymerase sigma factor
METYSTVEQVARESYGKLLAFLSMRTWDMAAAEDALTEAFLAALESWQRTGVPEKPEAWLLTAARRKLIDSARRAQTQNKAVPALYLAAEAAQKESISRDGFPDERLKMLFLCTHPAIDPTIRTPLMLQTVLGLDAARISNAFLVSPAAMGKRLFRAKAKIREARIRFELPEEDELPERLEAVLEAIYAVYNVGWDNLSSSDNKSEDLTEEALYLGRVLVKLLPEEPEAFGLLALMLQCEARQSARLNTSGEYVPLYEQDFSMWEWEKLKEADKCLIHASRFRKIGRFQLEAAIQSAHSQGVWEGNPNREGIALLYEGLVRLAPTVGALVGRAGAMAEAFGVSSGLSLLEEIPHENVNDYQPYWALAANLYQRVQKMEEATLAYGKAIGLCKVPAVREYLIRQQQNVI